MILLAALFAVGVTFLALLAAVAHAITHPRSDEDTPRDMGTGEERP